ncbi:MAG: hypothetical protein ACE15F_18575 [bacterium]
MPIMDGFVFDAAGARLLEEICPPDWLKQLDEALVSLQAEFRREEEEGYTELVKRLRAWTWCHQVPREHPDYVSLEALAELAGRIRTNFKAFVTVGIGGSDLGARTLHDLLNHPYHNELAAAGKIQGIPEIYFTGDTFDPLRLRALLDMLRRRDLLEATCVNIVSKSGTTAETALAGMVLAEALGPDWMRRAVATTGKNEKSLLYQMEKNGAGKFMGLLPVPDGVGGRFSFASPVGALLLAVTAPRDPLATLRDAYAGYAAAHEAFLTIPPALNPTYRIARFLHQAEAFTGKTAFVFYPYFDNRRLGDWFIQLYSESVQERGRGLNVLAATGPTGNHSLLNGVVNGPRDKAALFLAPRDFGGAMRVPDDAPLKGGLEIFKGITFAEAQLASLRGTAQDFTSRAVPNATLYFPKRDAGAVFALMRVLMDMVAVKGRLQSLHIDPLTGARRIEDEDTYIQTGVEGYKQRMREALQKNGD